MEATVWQVGAGSVNDRSRPVMRENAAVFKLMRRGAFLGLLAGAAYAAYRFVAARSPDTAGVTFQTSPVPSLPRPVPRIDAAAAAAPAPAAGRRLLVVVATAGVAALGAGEVVAGLLGEDRVDQIVLAKTAEAVDAELVGEQVEIGERGLRERGAIKYG